MITQRGGRERAKGIATSFLNLRTCKTKTTRNKIIKYQNIYTFLQSFVIGGVILCCISDWTNTQLQHVDFWSRKYPLPPAFGQKCKNRPAASGTRALFEVCVWGINAHLLQPTDGILLHRLNNFQDGNSYRQASRSYPRRMRRPQAWNGMVPRRPIAQGQMPIGRFVPCD